MKQTNHVARLAARLGQGISRFGLSLLPLSPVQVYLPAEDEIPPAGRPEAPDGTRRPPTHVPAPPDETAR